jgi:hypothetical protein
MDTVKADIGVINAANIPLLVTLAVIAVIVKYGCQLALAAVAFAFAVHS